MTGPCPSYSKQLEVLVLSCPTYNLQHQAWTLYRAGAQETFVGLKGAPAGSWLGRGLQKGKEGQ